MPVLFGLAALWIIVLLPDVLRRFSQRRPTDSISTFSRHMSVLERSHSQTLTPSRNNVVRFAPRSLTNRPTPLSRPVAPLVPTTRSSRQAELAGRPQAVRSQVSRPNPASSARDAAAQPALRRSPAQQRRQDVIVALVAASLLSFLATITFSGAFLAVHLVIDVALVAYVAAVLSVTRRTQSRGSVTYLPSHQVRGMVPAAAHHERRSAVH